MEWTKDNDKILINLINESKQYGEISTIMGTTIRSITNRCNRLGVKPERKSYHEKIICKNCKIDFKALITDGRKFCSHSCSTQFNNKNKVLSEETKNKISEGIIKYLNSGIENKRKSKPKCKVCGNEVKKTHNTYCSRVCKDNCVDFKHRQSQLAKKRYKENPEQHPNRLCAGLKESYPERFFREFLEQNGLINNVDYEQQYKIKTYYVDFYFPKINLCVEIDGERFHRRCDKELKREEIIKKQHNLIRFNVKTLLKKEYEDDILEIIKDVRVT